MDNKIIKEYSNTDSSNWKLLFYRYSLPIFLQIKFELQESGLRNSFEKNNEHMYRRKENITDN